MTLHNYFLISNNNKKKKKKKKKEEEEQQQQERVMKQTEQSNFHKSFVHNDTTTILLFRWIQRNSYCSVHETAVQTSLRANMQ